MHLDPLSTIASGHPLIDIDLTVFVQFGLFLLLLIISNKLLFQPYLQLRERRKAGIDGARAEGERKTAEAVAKGADYDKQYAQALNRANEESRKVRAEAAANEKDVTDKARAEAQKALDEATAKMRQETEAARLQLLPQANQLARQIASKMLGREVA